MLKDQQYNHLTSNTPMKLLTTIAAVLISISAFSQDYVEYDNGTFTQNGEELSMEQIYDLTVLYKAGRGNVRRGINFDEMRNDIVSRSVNNSINLVGGVASGAAGGFGVFIGALALDYGSGTGPAALFFVPGTGLCVVSYKAFSRIASSPEGCLRKRDIEFNKVAEKINQAIVRAGPTAPSSNQ